MLSIGFNLVPPFFVFLVAVTLFVLMVAAALFILVVVAALFLFMVVAALFVLVVVTTLSVFMVVAALLMVVAALFVLVVVAALFIFLVVTTLSVFMVVAVVEVTSVFFVALGFRDIWSFGVVLGFVVVLELRLVTIDTALVFHKVTSENSRSRVNNNLNIIFLFQNNYRKLI